MPRWPGVLAFSTSEPIAYGAGDKEFILNRFGGNPGDGSECPLGDPVVASHLPKK